MGESPLSYINSDVFRKKLLTKNLTPYAKAPNRPSLPVDTEYTQSDISVQDSPDQLIDEPSFANQLYPLNQWGNEGGYEQVPDVGRLNNTKSNQGEYGPGQQDARILEQAEPESKVWKKINAYSNGSERLLDSGEFIDNLDFVTATGVYNNQPYPTFNSSEYTPVSILLSPDPQGSNGLLSQDSFIAKLGASTLRKEFQERIASQIRQQTIDRANIFNVRSGTDVLNIVTGIVPILEPNWTITQPSNPILAATDFALRLAGSILPVSPIPGSYFDPNINSGQPTTIQQLTNAFRRSAIGGLATRLLGGGQTGSQLFYNNTGGGQKSRLFNNIDYNKYKPSFNRTLFDRVAGAVVGSTTDNGNYYVGSLTSDPSRVFSPGGDLPVNQYGQEQQMPVYGPQELAQLYEGPSRDVKLGANGVAYADGGGVEGGFTWVSPKYKGNAGKKVGVGGEVTNEDQDFRPSSYNSTESTNREFKQGSILDQTQRIINSQPQGGRRLQHVGNAIDQVSKVFNDGYKELTKGSKVLSYVGAIGQEVGTEYCRVFAKDIPYLQYNDLQKTDGTVTEGRRFSWSVLDKTYNLNIVPNKQEGGQSSSNLINAPAGQSINDAYAKKYMFSLENLAWRTSTTPGYAVADLPICERGPNGGRVMWFPPYGLTFSENTTASWKGQDFLGRPEPIYTYSNTNRTGSLQWKIVVDHPSVLNVIVNKVLSNETNKTRIDSILESFFAGCRKYDLYELAKKYYTVNPNDLYEIQQAITSKELSTEQLVFTKQTIQSGTDSTDGATQPVAGNPQQDSLQKYVNVGLYFPNDYPKKGGDLNYNTSLSVYQSQKDIYKKKEEGQQTEQFFTNVVDANLEGVKSLISELKKQLSNSTGSITIIVNASASAPASITYNDSLSERRIQSFIDYILSDKELKAYNNATPKRFIIQREVGRGEVNDSNPLYLTNGELKPGKNFPNCSDQQGDSLAPSNDVYSVRAMACRRSFIKAIKNDTQIPPTEKPNNNIDVVVGNVVTTTKKVPVIEEKLVNRNNITKRVLRALLSECDYFETIKAESPMVYDNLRDKLKFFQPAFHSTTPEGLNSRLTFLQQCMRPGDTIPTVRDIEGQPPLQYNNATNTAFGAPPVLVLRVGDFYNTKIIPTSLQLTYENLDLNPEGIGIQPMIANVTLSFNFVGGSGLKNSIDKLQNALTFNYYANTEMWDDRADVTDQSYEVLDKDFLNAVTSTQPPAQNQSPTINGQSNDSTIGTILTNNIGDFEVGTISYSDFMEKVKTDTQTYFQTVVSKLKETVNQYNNGMRQQFMAQRNYTQGEFNVEQGIVRIFGKAKNIEKRVGDITKEFIKNIKDDDEGFIKFISQPQKDFSNKLLRQVKENYVNYINNKSGTFQNPITVISQDLVNIEQGYIKDLGRVNTVTFEGVDGYGTDGLQQKNGNVRIYNTSGTTQISSSSKNVSNTFEELIADVKLIRKGLIDFATIIQTPQKFVYSGDKKEYEGTLVFEVSLNGDQLGQNKLTTKDVFFPFSTNTLMQDDFSFRRAYFLLSDDIVDDKKYENFKQKMIRNIINNPGVIGKGADNIEQVFDAYWKAQAKPVFVEENNITKEFIDFMEKNRLKDFLNYTPYDKKERVFSFNTEVQAPDVDKKSQESLIKGLGAINNLNTNVGTWNDIPSGGATGAYVSKAKLN